MKWFLMINYETEKPMYGGLFENFEEFVTYIQGALNNLTEDCDYRQVIEIEDEKFISDDWNVYFATINDFYSLEEDCSFEEGDLVRKITSYYCAIYETDLENNVLIFPEKLVAS